MRSHLYIFSSRCLGSAALWTVLVVVAIEFSAAGRLPGNHFNHEVDKLLYELDGGNVQPGETLFLGDSVGRQIARAVLERNKNAFVPLASNAAIETSGQYMVLRRYLDKYPPPRRVLLMMLNPVEGELHTVYTENYVQRCFLRWDEIADLTRSRRSLPFAVTMATYKVLPSYRYRIRLQEKVSWLTDPNSISAGKERSAKPKKIKGPKPRGVLNVISKSRKARDSGRIASAYFRRMAALLDERGIEFVYLFPPLKESSSADLLPAGIYGRQLEEVADVFSAYPQARIGSAGVLYPDAWFVDGTHFDEQNLVEVSEDYERLLMSPTAGGEVK